jgi:hypothetical protein
MSLVADAPLIQVSVLAAEAAPPAGTALDIVHCLTAVARPASYIGR